MDQIANAIHNAQLIRKLDLANQELVRSKTFEAIATATGEGMLRLGQYGILKVLEGVVDYRSVRMATH